MSVKWGEEIIKQRKEKQLGLGGPGHCMCCGDSSTKQRTSTSPRRKRSLNPFKFLGDVGYPNCKYEKTGTKPIGDDEASNTAVFLVKRVKDGAEFAAKVMNMESMNEHETQLAIGETRCLGCVNHFAIMKLVDQGSEDKDVVLVTEYADACDLRKCIKDRQDLHQPLEETVVWQVTLQLLLAVDHIHSRNILHRDIKAANIFLMSSGLVKLGDFGFARQYTKSVKEDVSKEFCGSVMYIAPEVWRRKPYNLAADMWAVGVVLYELMALKRPFDGASTVAIRDLVLSDRDPPPLPARYSEELRKITALLLQRDRAKRPSAKEVLLRPLVVKQMKLFLQAARDTQEIPEELRRDIQTSVDEFYVKNKANTV